MNLKPNISLHPYFGFGFRQGLTPREFLSDDRIQNMLAPNGKDDWLGIESNSLGFWSRYPFPYYPGNDEFVIGVFGGSIAKWFSLQSSALLEKLLSDHLKKKVVVLNFSMGGMKHPQQGQILSYLLQIGQKLDMVLNIDGLNEIIFGKNNDKHNLEMTWPSIHMISALGAAISKDINDRNNLKILLKASRYKKWRDSINSLKHNKWIAPIGGILDSFEDFFRSTESKILQQIQIDPEKLDSDMLILPKAFLTTDESNPTAQLVRSSIFLNNLSTAYLTKYIHVLQPNHHLGNKVMSKHEKVLFEHAQEIFSSLREEHGDIVTHGVDKLKKEKITLINATGIFDNISESVYCDSSGHLNQRGNELLAIFLFDEISRVISP